MHYSLSLLVTRDISAMCFIIAPHPDRVSRERPMRIPERLTIKATPLSSGLVKAKTGNTTDTTIYNDWYKAAYMPVVAEEDEGGVA
mgnify:CR=1 FL=1